MITIARTMILVIFWWDTPSTLASDISSSYTTLDFEKHCTRIDGIEENSNEAGQGGTYRCKGYQDYPIILKVGDLRESVQFGALNQNFIDHSWESFGPWNSINSTVEWRLRNNKPIAVIHRAFIDNINPDTGTVDAKLRGQVLVISSIATDENGGIGCVAGLVDARANKQANTLARAVADKIDNTVTCTMDKTLYVGKIGPTSAPMSRHYPVKSP